MTETNLDQRLAALESRLSRLEQLLGSLNARLEAAPAPGETKTAIQAWVTDYVSLRLQQLVPETCEHPADEGGAGGEEIAHRLDRPCAGRHQQRRRATRVARIGGHAELDQPPDDVGPAV